MPEDGQFEMELLVVLMHIMDRVMLHLFRRNTYNHLSSWLTDARNLTNPNTVSNQ